MFRLVLGAVIGATVVALANGKRFEELEARVDKMADLIAEGFKKAYATPPTVGKAPTATPSTAAKPN